MKEGEFNVFVLHKKFLEFFADSSDIKRPFLPSKLSKLENRPLVLSSSTKGEGKVVYFVCRRPEMAPSAARAL